MYTRIYLYKRIYLYTHRDLSIILRVALAKSLWNYISFAKLFYSICHISRKSRGVRSLHYFSTPPISRINTARRNKREDDSLGCIYRLDSTETIQLYVFL